MKGYPCFNCGTCPGVCKEKVEKYSTASCLPNCTRGLTQCEPKKERCDLKQSIIEHLTSSRPKAIKMVYALRKVGMNIHPDKTRFGGFNIKMLPTA